MNFPNKITSADFEGWVQERGLYFASTWDKRFEAPISCADPGEQPHAGGLLYARAGKGVYIFTAYSWFRQLPAGVPGAYRIFANLLSAGKALDRGPPVPSMRGIAGSQKRTGPPRGSLCLVPRRPIDAAAQDRGHLHGGG